MSLKNKGDFLMHGVVLQIRVFRYSPDVSRETFLRNSGGRLNLRKEDTNGRFARISAGRKRRPAAGASPGLCEATRGLVMAEAVTMALADRIGRLDAHHLVESACQRALAEGAHLRDVLAREPAVMAQLTPETLDCLFAPESYLGMAERFVQRVLATSPAWP